MTPEPRRPRLNWLGLVTALMVALAGGAVWALVALWHESELCFLALPLSAFIGTLLRRPGPGVNVVGGVLALLFSALACTYALGLIATAHVSLLLGQRLTDTLHRIGTDMALSVAWARLDAFDLACLAAALLLGTACAALPRRSSRPVFPAD